MQQQLKKANNLNFVFFSKKVLTKLSGYGILYKYRAVARYYYPCPRKVAGRNPEGGVQNGKGIR